jgi:hypothetical protein
VTHSTQSPLPLHVMSVARSFLHHFNLLLNENNFIFKGVLHEARVTSSNLSFSFSCVDMSKKKRMILYKLIDIFVFSQCDTFLPTL